MFFNSIGRPIDEQEHCHTQYMSCCLNVRELRLLSINRSISNFKKIGIHGSNDITNSHWRWCDQCVEEDIDRYGITYFHRDHQIPGVMHCSKHRCKLIGKCNGCGFSATTIKKLLLPPENNKCPDCNGNMGEDSSYFDEKMACLESDSLALAYGHLEFSFDQVADRALNFMGLNLEQIDSTIGRKKIRLFNIGLQHYYQATILKSYYHSVIEREFDVICNSIKSSRLFNKESTQKPVHPLSHLLVLQYVDANTNKTQQEAA